MRLGRWMGSLVGSAGLGAIGGLALGWSRARSARGRGAARGGGASAGRRAVAHAPRGTAQPDVPDDELVARVRRLADVPPWVEVAVVDGAVVLFGRVPSWEVQPMLDRVVNVDGVSTVENRLSGDEGGSHSGR